MRREVRVAIPLNTKDKNARHVGIFQQKISRKGRKELPGGRFKTGTGIGNAYVRQQ
jgi:hypothetical protein